jgi:hypothetical protein
MINYNFFQFIKKKFGPDRTVDRPVGVRPPGANGGTGSGFSNLDRLGPDRADRAGPWTVDRAGPWTVRVWTGPTRTGPYSILYHNLSVITMLGFTKGCTKHIHRNSRSFSSRATPSVRLDGFLSFAPPILPWWKYSSPLHSSAPPLRASDGGRCQH